MAKTNEEILEAVRALDPQNDEHWTADGLPRLDAVENLLGSDVSRKTVTDAASSFTRAAAQELAEAEPLTGEETGDPLAEGSVESEPTASEEIGDPLAEGSADLEAELDAEIQGAQERIQAIREGLDEGKRVLLEVEGDLGRLRDKKNQQFPPMTQAEAIQRFQRNELAKRAVAQGVTGPSPLDSAMRSARKVRRQAPMGDGARGTG